MAGFRKFVVITSAGKIPLLYISNSRYFHYTFLRNNHCGITVCQDQEFYINDAEKRHFKEWYTSYNNTLCIRENFGIPCICKICTCPKMSSLFQWTERDNPANVLTKHISTNNLPLILPTVHNPLPYNNFGISSIQNNCLKKNYNSQHSDKRYKTCTIQISTPYRKCIPNKWIKAGVGNPQPSLPFCEDWYQLRNFDSWNK